MAVALFCCGFKLFPSTSVGGEEIKLFGFNCKHHYRLKHERPPLSEHNLHLKYDIENNPAGLQVTHPADQHELL